MRSLVVVDQPRGLGLRRERRAGRSGLHRLLGIEVAVARVLAIDDDGEQHPPPLPPLSVSATSFRLASSVRWSSTVYRTPHPNRVQSWTSRLTESMSLAVSNGVLCRYANVS